MADPTPLLPQYSSSNSHAPNPSFTHDHSIDTTTGIAQLFQAILVSFAWAFDAQQTFISVFTDAVPTWHCVDGQRCSSARSSTCGLPQGSWAWDRPERTSVVSEWYLQCLAPTLLGLPATSYFIGCFIGGFLLATLADSSLGRKNMLVISLLIMSASGALSAISPNLWVYSILRFMCGIGRSTVTSNAIVLTTEIVGDRWRGKASIVGFFCFTLGFLSLPAMAYVGRGSSWRALYLWTSVPSLCYTIFVYFFARESPRWLLLNECKEKPDVFLSAKILWQKKWACRRLAAMMTAGFGIGLVYYGMPLNLGNLGSNLYLSVTFNALAELPSALATFFLIGTLDRKTSTLLFTTASSTCNLICAFVASEGVRAVAELVSFFSVCTAFNVVLIYSMELFPTCVRNSAVSMVRQAIVFGGVFAPMLVTLGRERRFLSFGVFGLLIGSCGMFVAWLPETRGCAMNDTMEEEEYREIVS